MKKIILIIVCCFSFMSVYTQDLSVNNKSKEFLNKENRLLFGNSESIIQYPPINIESNGKVGLIVNTEKNTLHKKAIFFNTKNNKIYLIIDGFKTIYGNKKIALDIKMENKNLIGWKFEYGTKKPSIIFDAQLINGAADSITFGYNEKLDEFKLFEYEM